MASGVELATAYVTLAVEGKDVAPQTRKAFTAVDAQADRTGKSAGKRLGSGLGGGIAAAAKSFAGPIAAAFGAMAVGNFLKDSVAEARESQKVGALTANVIKQTGGAAKITADQVGDLATAISNKTGIDDEAIQTGSNLLLTFKNVRNEAGKGSDVFNRATQAAVDLSAAGFGSVDGAAKMLGKALNDPLKGISALGRAGVTFTDGQKKQIKAMVEAGDVLGAQKIIMKEVESQVGGAAAASATAGEKLAVVWGNFKESIGTRLLPVIDRLAGFLTSKLIPAAGQVFDVLFRGDFTSGPFSEDSKMVDVLFRIRDGLIGAAGVAKQFFGILFQGDFKSGPLSEDGKFVDVLFRLRDGFFKVRDGAAALGGWLKNDLWPALKDAYQTIMPAVKSALDTIRGGASGGGIEGARSAFKAFGDIVVTKVIPVLAFIAKNVLPVVALNIRSLIEVVKVTWKVFTTMASIAARAFSIVLGAIIGVTKTFQGMLRALSNVPGFGWAKTAADKMGGTIAKLHAIKNGIDQIPNQKTVTIAVSTKLLGPGRINVGGKQVNVGMKAGGGPVAANTPYWVGDNPDGTLNRTSELFVPRTSGTIFNQSQLARSSAPAAAEPASAAGVPRVIQLVLQDGRVLTELVMDGMGNVLSGGRSTVLT